MHVSGDLGFSNLVLVVCLVFPVVFLVIRRKWRLAVSRKEEVKRLLVLASEEAAKAELEASITYGVVSVSPGYHCAVCYSPTTTRCARCKAVRYCSGKCQIIHWRQGHKDNCHPPTGTFRANDEVIDSAQKVAVQDRCKIYGQRLKIENRLLTEQIEVYPVESELSASSSSSKVPCGNIDDVKEFHADEEVVNSATESSGNSCAGFFASPTSSVSSDDVSVCESDDIKVEFQADNEGENSPSESSGTLFSGFSSSPSRSESSDDSSVSESISSNEHEMAKGPLTADIAGGLPETTISLKDMGLDKPLLPKFTSLVESVDNFSKLNKINQIKSSSGNAENQCVSSSCTDLDAAGKYEGSAADNSIPCSDFWSRTLESIESINDTCNGSAPSKYGGTSKSDLTDSGSFLHFSFSLPGSTSPLYSHVSEVRNTASTALGSNEVANGIASLVASHVKNSVSRESSTMVKDRTETALHDAQSKEVKPSPSLSRADLPSTVTGVSTSTDASHISSLSSSGSEKLNGIVNDPGSSSPPLKSRDVRHSSSSNFKADLTSSAVEDSARSAKHGSAKGIETTRTVVSQVTSSPNGKNGLKTSVWKVVDQFRGSKLLKNHPLAGGSENAGRYSDKGLFMYELFVKLYTSNKIELQPCGLLNCGNSCYANAVLQCLTFTPPLTAYFLQGLHSKTCVNKKWCFTCEFENMILKAKEAKAPLSPSGILSQLRNSGSQLGNGREEDAHEFLRYAIDAMQSVCLMEAGANASGSLEKEETTLVGLTFGGYLQSKIQCMKCQGKSERHERMMDLTVEIEGDIGTLEEALRRFTGTEILDGENKYRCGRCKSYERAKKKLKILEAPNVLTIALKRFQSGKFGKLNKSIQFPEILNLAPYMSGTSDKSPIYRLYGVVVHLDVMNAAFSGHYVCYVKNFQNKWFKIDDSVVTTTELEKVLTKGAYMLLYARYSPRAPRLIRNKIVSSDPKNKVPSGENGKISWSKLASMRSGIVQHDPNSVSADGPASIESFYSKFHRLQRILEEDSSSDSSSLISSHSDEGSCSTDSTRDSASIDDFSDFVFGDLGRGWSSTWRNSSDSDTSSSSSSSSSPLYSRHSPLAVSDRYARTSGCRPDDYVSDPARDGNRDRSCNGNSRPVDLEGKGSDPFLYSDMTKQCRKLGNSSSCRATDSEKVGWFNQLKDVKVGASLRKSTRERTE